MSAQDDLMQQILGQNLTSKWKGGHGPQDAARDMAKLMADVGITDIKQFGKIPVYEKAESKLGFQGQVAQQDADGNYYVMAPGGVDSEGYPYNSRQNVDPSQLKPIYGKTISTPEGETVTSTFQPLDPSQLVMKDGVATYKDRDSFGNKETGQLINRGSGRWEGQGGDNLFSGTGAGKGNTGFRVNFADDGTPIFYTTQGSSNDLAAIMKDLGPIGQIGLAVATAGLSLPAQIATNMAIQIAAGQNPKDAIKNAAISLAVANIPGTDFMKEAGSAIKNLGLDPALTSTINNAVQNAAMSGARAVLSGQDVSDAMLKGAAAGGVNGAVNELMKNIPDFDKLTPTQKRMASNAVVGVISGKPLDQIMINTAISAATAEVAEQKRYAPLDDKALAELTPEEKAIYDESGTKGLMKFGQEAKAALAAKNADLDALKKSGLTTTDDNIVVTGNKEYDDFLATIGITNPTKLKDSGLSNQDIDDLIHGRTPVKKVDPKELVVTAPRNPDDPTENPIFTTPVSPSAPNIGPQGTVTITDKRPPPSPALPLEVDPITMLPVPIAPTLPPTAPAPAPTTTPPAPAINIDPVKALQEIYNPFAPSPASKSTPSQTDTGPIQLMTDVFGTNIATAQKTGARGYGFSAGGDIDELLRLLRS